MAASHLVQKVACFNVNVFFCDVSARYKVRRNAFIPTPPCLKKNLTLDMVPHTAKHMVLAYRCIQTSPWYQ